jgi:hypothetical protein
MDESIKNLIIIINTVIRMLVIIIVNNVGYITESNQMKYITNSVFICIFFNTGFLLMLCNANLGDQSALLGSYFKGNDSDFNQSWFTSMGDTIVGSMVFNVWFPVVMEFCNYGMRLGFRILDWFGRKNGALTTKTSIQQYINLHAGPQYFMHYKYSSVMNIVFITMMFGAGLPVLFPIAAASLTVLFCLEKFMLYYIYKQPPVYDERLNNSVLSNLDKAPFFLLGFGYWMLTNLQLIENEHLTPVWRKSDPFMAGHTWYNALTPSGAF